MIPDRPSEVGSPPPHKRARLGDEEEQTQSNGSIALMAGPSLPPLSMSILGMEPLDEFILEIADFIHHMIMTRPPEPTGTIEVEAKIGVLKHKGTGQRFTLPVRVETGEF